MMCLMARTRIQVMLPKIGKQQQKNCNKYIQMNSKNHQIAAQKKNTQTGICFFPSVSSPSTFTIIIEKHIVPLLLYKLLMTI